MSWDWRDDAACYGSDAHTAEGETGPQIEAARAVCNSCPVAVSCLWWALTRRMTAGMWGGMTTQERERLLARGTIPAVPTVGLGDLFPTVALADRIDAYRAAGRRDWAGVIGLEIGVGKESIRQWYVAFNNRLKGGFEQRNHSIMKAG